MLSVNLNRNPPWSSGVPFEILKALGGADKTLIVGGAVRDWLCDEPIGDIDFATKLPPNESLQLLLDSGFNVKPTGIDHGTITVYSDNKSYEITSLRGTLVPARNLNILLSKIPVLGDILIPKDVGEGLFGISFKMKGSHGEIKTTVNPIKTLTPRFRLILTAKQ